MSPRTSRFVAVFLACLALASAPVASQASAAVVSDKLMRGELESSAQDYPGSDIDWGRAVLMVDAPADKVMSVVTDYANYKSLLPNFKTSRVLAQRGNSANVYVELEIMNGAAKIWAELKLREKKQDGSATRVIEGTMTKGNVELFHAVWEVTPYDQNRTLVAIQLMVDPDLPLPDSMLSDENQKSARKALRALRAKVAPASVPNKK